MAETGPKLRDLRRERGLTQQEVADLLRESASTLRRASRGGDLQEVGVDGQMVSKWERGEKRPAPIYRELLCRIFEVDYLSLWSTAQGKEDLTRRRDFLALGAASAVASSGLTSAPYAQIVRARATTVSPRLLESLETAIAGIEAQFEYLRPQDFLPTIQIQESIAAHLLDSPCSESGKYRLLLATGYLSSLHANVAFNATDFRVARQKGRDALALAELSMSDELRAWSLVNLSMFEFYLGNFSQARDISSMPCAQNLPMAAYLHNFRARALASLGDKKEAERAVGDSYRVMDSLTLDQQGEPGFSLRTFNRADLDCETATVYATMNDPEQAIRYSESAIKVVDTTDKSGLRAQVRFPVATAQVALGRVEEAHQSIVEAHNIASERQPWWFVSRYAEFQRNLVERDGESSYRELERRIQSMRPG